MIRKGLVLGTVSILIAVFVYWGTSSGAKDCGGIPAEKVADMVHAVIQSHRTFYTVHIVERLQAKGVVVASENWESENTLPLPVQLLQESARLAVNTSAKIGYKLISLWLLTNGMGPKPNLSKKGLWKPCGIRIVPIPKWSCRGEPRISKPLCRQGCSQACIGCHISHPDGPETELQAE